MIRMIQSKSAGQAKDYFTAALSKSDYYTNDQELAGFWQGKLAERLGLSGATSKEDFFALCENHHPQTGEPLTPRTKENRTTAYDINFHCPKSVSVLHVLSQDDHILTAFQDSVTETMQAIEKDAKTRVRLDGRHEDRETGELVWGHFTHQTARPVEDEHPDPHLHSHCFVFNATWDEREGRIKAGQFREIKQDMPYYQAQFHKILSDKLVELGYSVRRTDKSFEIEGVPQKVIDLFSKRTDEIGRFAKEKGITDARDLGELGARTRAKKQKGCSMDELKKEWREQIAELGEDGKDGGIVRYAPDRAQPSVTVSKCLDHAVEHCFERASVMHERRFLETAFRHSIGMSGATVKEISDAYQKDERMLRIKEGSRMKCTTQAVIREEQKMVELAQHGQGKMFPLYSTAPTIELAGQQGEAIRHVLTTRNRVSIIRGAAGSGKTTLMQEAVKHFENAQKEVFVFAPTVQASRGVLKEEGFEKAETVAKLLNNPEMQERLKNQVLWVDEAGLLGTKDMTALLEIATRQNARLILGGDTRQHASVVRGDALRILNTVAAIEVAEVNKIYRQKNAEYRAAIEDLSKGDVAAGFQKLDRIGSIKEVDHTKINEALVSDYMNAIRQGKSALVISPTHAQGEAITKDIRERMRLEKLLGKKDKEFVQFKSRNLTQAEKADVRNFEDGQVVQFSQNVKGFTRGSMWTVEKDGPDVMLRNNEGIRKPLPHQNSHRYDVFDKRCLQLAKGDKVLITRTGFDSQHKRLENGDIFEVASVKNDGVTLRNVRSGNTVNLGDDFGHIAYAHYVTSHASQGKTVDQVFIYQPAETFAATNAKQFYVSASRGREKALIYTNDKEQVLEHSQEIGDRMGAMELLRTRHRDFEYYQPQKEQLSIVQHKQERDYEPDR